MPVTEVLSPYDELLPVPDEEAKEWSLRLAKEEGIFCGLSSGATVCAAMKVAEKAEAGSAILAMLPDTGERYLSTYLFEEVHDGSDDEWEAGL